VQTVWTEVLLQLQSDSELFLGFLLVKMQMVERELRRKRYLYKPDFPLVLIRKQQISIQRLH